MSEQLQLRRGTAAQIASFTGAAGEVVVDTTNNRLVLQDGATVGGFAAAKLSEVAGSTSSRTPISDANYSALTSDTIVAYTALTATRTVTLPSSAAYPQGKILWIVDESGAASGTINILINRSGADTINGATSTLIASAYMALGLESSGSGKWTVIGYIPNSQFNLVGVGTAPDPSNPLSVKASQALFNAVSANFTLYVNKAAAGATASIIFEDAFSSRAQIGLQGNDNFTLQVSPNGSSFINAMVVDASTGAATFANQRTSVADAAYSALVTDRTIAYTSITAARAVTLPAAGAFPQGHRLLVIDESGSCSATNTITVTRAGSDTINGATTSVISTAYGFVAIESNGSNAWTVCDSPGGGSISPSSATPNMDGVGAAGVATNYARGDHVHPSDTSRAPLASPTFTGTPAAPTATAGTNTTQIATTAFVAASFAPLASPALTGTPTAPTAAASTNTTQIATTAFVLGQAATAAPLVDGTAAVGVSTLFARQDHVHPSDTTRAAISGATFTGSVTIPSGVINGATVGATTPSTGAFTTLSATSTVTYAAGTATASPAKFQSGTNLTTAAAGAMEYDGAVFYATVAASERGVLPAEQIEILSSSYTLTSQTAAQKLLNGTANGTITLAVGAYQFECFFSLTSLSATSGSFGFSLGGTATFTQTWESHAAQVATLATAATLQSTFNTAANTALTTAGTNTSGYAFIKGVIRITAAGTIIPQVSLTVAAAAVVGANSYFKIAPLGASTLTNVGNWS